MSKMMKRMVLVAVGLTFALSAQAQLVVGLQGGYHDQKNSYSWTDSYDQASSYIGGLQLGYQITSKWYVGVVANYMGTKGDRMLENDVLANYSAQSNVPIEEHRVRSDRAGWSVQPLVRYEIFKYGNMHFHLMLQGNVASMGYTSNTESFYTPTINNREYIEYDPVADSVSSFAWSVSLWPTLTYEFSTHLSAELSLDFLSVGYAASKVKHDADFHTVDGEQVADVYSSRTLYAGLNTLMQTLDWESPMLRLGFNYKF